MALNITASLIATILATVDSNQGVPINFGTGNPAYDSTSSAYNPFIKLLGVTNIFLPAGVPATMVYIQNVDAAKTITVNWTPNGGAANNICVLNPGAQIILWDNPAAATTPGITALTLTPSAAPALVAIYIGA